MQLRRFQNNNHIVQTFLFCRFTLAPATLYLGKSLYIQFFVNYAMLKCCDLKRSSQYLDITEERKHPSNQQVVRSYLRQKSCLKRGGGVDDMLWIQTWDRRMVSTDESNELLVRFLTSFYWICTLFEMSFEWMTTDPALCNVWTSFFVRTDGLI